MIRKRVGLKPVLLMEITAIILIASIGVAVALNAAGTLKGGDYDVDLNYGTITDTVNITVDDYLLTYDADCSDVTGVTVYLSNAIASDVNINLTVAVGNDAWGTTQTETEAKVVTASASSEAHTVTLTTSLLVTDLGRIHIYVEEV